MCQSHTVLVICSFTVRVEIKQFPVTLIFFGIVHGSLNQLYFYVHFRKNFHKNSKWSNGCINDTGHFY